jgi:hypothetical protein
MLTLTKEKFDDLLKELDKAIERANIVLSTTDQPPVQLKPLLFTKKVSKKELSRRSVTENKRL